MAAPASYIFGIHAVLTLLQKEPQRILRLCISDKRHDHKIAELMHSSMTRCESKRS